VLKNSLQNIRTHFEEDPFLNQPAAPALELKTHVSVSGGTRAHGSSPPAWTAVSWSTPHLTMGWQQETHVSSD